jgi:glycosyltransferase involved in cell wall biosynthesis
MWYFKPVKIAIDIKSTEGEKTGKGYYTEHLVNSLMKIDKKNEYILYSHKNIKGRSIFYHINLWFKLKKEKPDIFFAPTSYIVPAFAPKKIKVVFTVHDLVAFLFPGKHNKKATFIEKMTLKKALGKAKRVVCVSRNTAKDLEEKFNYPASKTEIVYCAAGDEYRQTEDTEKVKKKYDLPKKFILGVGTIEPRKNFEGLIEAFRKIKNDIDDLYLVIIGTKGWCTGEIEKLERDLEIKNKIKFLGYAKYEDLVAIYNLAEIFVFPSIYEGFGMPPLEAMKSGCPVICSNTSSLPEVCGDSAYMVNPHDIRAIEGGIREILGDEKLREHLKNKGLKQAEKFSWEKSAQKLLELFENL